MSWNNVICLHYWGEVILSKSIVSLSFFQCLKMECLVSMLKKPHLARLKDVLSPWVRRKYCTNEGPGSDIIVTSRVSQSIKNNILHISCLTILHTLNSFWNIIQNRKYLHFVQSYCFIHIEIELISSAPADYWISIIAILTCVMCDIITCLAVITSSLLLTVNPF